MRLTARLFLGLTALVQMIAALRSMVDASSVSAWRGNDVIWGKTALPLNVAMSVVASIGFLIAATADNPFSPSARWRFVPYVVLYVAQGYVTETGFFLPVVSVIAFVAACYEGDEATRRENVDDRSENGAERTT